MNTPLHRTDPLASNGPDSAKALFEKLARAADSHPADDVIGASMNMIVNAIRQVYPTRTLAEQRINEVMGKTKEILLGFYDGTTNRRKSVIPFDQYVFAPHHDDRETINGRKQ